MMTVQYFIRNVYGTQTLYVTGEAMKWVNVLTHRKTVTLKDLQALEKLGIKIERIEDPETV